MIEKLTDLIAKAAIHTAQKRKRPKFSGQRSVDDKKEKKILPASGCQLIKKSVFMRVLMMILVKSHAV
ncbi:MAG: hypothetical protein JXR73_08600 [Candidatus Omnitrophica bacterium]|nr:hypothetical protein [Candidatus Omnitrophota bacterium]